MPIEGELANLPAVVMEQLDKLHARIADLEAQLKQKEAELKDVRNMRPAEYKKAKAQIRSGMRERERKPVPVEGVADVRTLTSGQYADAFSKATRHPYRPNTRGVVYGTPRVARKTTT